MKKSHFASLTAAVLGLAVGALALAQQGDENKNANRDRANASRGSSGRQTIHGVVAGVTVEGEMAIDYRTNRAEVAEVTILTIVGSPARGNRDRNAGDNATNRNDRNSDRGNANAGDNATNRNDRNSDRGNRASSNERRRHNVYLVAITPRTKVRMANSSSGDNANANARGNDDNNANAKANRNSNNNNDANNDRGIDVALERLEVGDRVEVTMNIRDESGSGSNAGNANAGNANAAARAKHGRHRTYFGDAVEINILDTNDGDRGDADSNRDGGRGQDNNNRRRDNQKDQDNAKKDNNDKD